MIGLKPVPLSPMTHEEMDFIAKCIETYPPGLDVQQWGSGPNFQHYTHMGHTREEQEEFGGPAIQLALLRIDEEDEPKEKATFDQIQAAFDLLARTIFPGVKCPGGKYCHELRCRPKELAVRLRQQKFHRPPPTWKRIFDTLLLRDKGE